MRVFSDPGLARLREAVVTMVATLLSFGSTLGLKHAVGLTSSAVVLAVFLALSLNRQRAERPQQHPVALLIAPLLLPFFAVGAAEVGRRMFTHPDLGDTLFVAGMAGAIWVRRFGAVGRRVGILVSITLTASLVTPGPAVPIGPDAPSRWWGAVVALIVLAWVRVAWFVGEWAGLLPARPAGPPVPGVPARTPQPGAPWHRRLPVSTKLALQMAAALAAAFAAGRWLFGIHWTWTVLTAYIIGSGNRGRGDVTHKAALRIGGAAVGTLIATALANAFPAHDDWSVVTIFCVIAVALWLRPLSYAYWAGGMTAALALLYGFYGQQGTHLLVDRLEGILLGAALGVAAAWIVLPVRNVDVIRRQLVVALRAIAGELAEDRPDVRFAPEAVALIRESTRSAELASRAVRWLPHSAASRELARGARALSALPDHRLALSIDARVQLSSDVTAARRALAADAARDQVAALPDVASRIAAALGG
ncbi:MAG TPA: FUSC family protein [Mycobacteriales bacterium]|nr:FUSC family protein [Mycobacteriales bacterium]